MQVRNPITGEPVVQAEGFRAGISECDLTMYSDLHKDAYGFRARPSTELTAGEFRAELRKLSYEVARQIEAEEDEDYPSDFGIEEQKVYFSSLCGE